MRKFISLLMLLIVLSWCVPDSFAQTHRRRHRRRALIGAGVGAGSGAVYRRRRARRHVRHRRGRRHHAQALRLIAPGSMAQLKASHSHPASAG